MEAHRKDFPTGGNQAAEAFAWRVADNLADGGVVGLLLPAMTLFKYESTGFRREFFTRLSVWCVANFANLAEVLFAGSPVPAAAFFYTLRDSDKVQNGADGILTFAPFVANQEANRPVGRNRRKDTWNIIVNASEIQTVSAGAAAEGGQLPWKTAMWGSARDAKLLAVVSNRFPSLEAFSQERGIHIHQGLEFRGREEPGAELIKELIGKKLLIMDRLRNCGTILSFPKEVLESIPKARAYVREGRGKLPLLVSRPPHVIVDAARRFAVFSNQFIGVPARQIGIAGPPHEAIVLKALSLFLMSEFSLYFQFFNSPGWGVKRERATLRALKEIPVPFENIPAKELKAWERLHSEFLNIPDARTLFSKRRTGRGLEALLRELNDRTFDILKIGRSEKSLVEDLVNVRLPLDEGKLSGEAIDPPSTEELESYAANLETELDSFLDKDSHLCHAARVVRDGQSAMAEIKLSQERGTPKKAAVLMADAHTTKEFERARALLRRKHSQWVYFDRDLIIFDGDVTYLFKPLQRVHWTRSQAAVDADQIISETLTSRSE